MLCGVMYGNITQCSDVRREFLAKKPFFRCRFFARREGGCGSFGPRVKPSLRDLGSELR
jgi:hypothetical protein